MKIIHTADLHFDSKMETNLTREMAKERKLELRLTFQRLVEYASENDVQAILICGDMFDGQNVQASTLTFLSDLIKKYNNIDFLVVKGNHDEFNLSTLGDFDNLKFFGNEFKYYTYGNVVISGLDLNNGYIPTRFDLLNFDKNNINILCLHGQVENRYSLNTDYCIPLNMLAGKNIDYLALGHIHNFGCGQIDARGIFAYSGNLEPRGFDECGQKGFIELEITDKVNYKFVPFSKRQFCEINVDISNCNSANEILDDVLNSTSDVSSDNLLKIILRGQYEIGLDKDLAYLNKALNEKFYFAKVVDDSNIKADFDKLKLDISLKGEFVRLVLSDNTLDEKQKNMIIDYGIKALTKGEIQ